MRARPVSIASRYTYGSMIGIGCFLIVIAKPLAKRDLHAGLFGITLACVAVYQLMR